MMKRWMIALALLVALLGIGIGLLFLLGPRICHGGDRTIPSSLKTLATAESDFRANDRAKTGREEFWRKDVAGLWGLIPKGGTDQDRIRLIEVSVALADDRPLTDLESVGTRGPKSGYWFRAIRKKGEPPLNSGTQFAFCAFPASYSSGSRYTFIIDEENTLWKADLGHGRGIEVFPDEAELKRQWKKLD
jgi:hypothetical protein